MSQLLLFYCVELFTDKPLLIYGFLAYLQKRFLNKTIIFSEITFCKTIYYLAVYLVEKKYYTLILRFLYSIILGIITNVIVLLYNKWLILYLL